MNQIGRMSIAGSPRLKEADGIGESAPVLGSDAPPMRIHSPADNGPNRAIALRPRALTHFMSTPRGTAYLPEATLEAARELITECSSYEGEPDGVIVSLA
jgi:hypothetical protein